MKTTIVFCFLILIALGAVAQNSLFGTWEMISIKGINADNERFSYDTTTVREIKVITPTHYMLIAENIVGDSVVFNRSYAGTVKLDGNRYIETPLISSLPIFDNVKSNFTWKIQGDKFIQAGTFTRPDGKTIILEEMLFKKVKADLSNDNNPAIGTWRQLSSTYTDYDGKNHAHTNATTERFQIITPTHWLRISHIDGKFENAMLGTYKLKGGISFPELTRASFPVESAGKMESDERVEGDILFVNGVMTAADGKKFTWHDEFERVK
jgi:hypothetical protein